MRRKQCLHSLLCNYSKNLICKRKLIPKNPQNKQRKQFKNPTRGAWSKGFQDYQTPSWSGTCVADWEASHFSVMKTYRSAVAKANIQLMLNCYWDMWAPPLAPPPMFHPTTPPLPPPPPLSYILPSALIQEASTYAGIFPSSCSRLNLRVREDDSAACIQAGFSEAASRRLLGGKKSVCAALSTEEALLNSIASGVAITLQKVWGAEKLPLIFQKIFELTSSSSVKEKTLRRDLRLIIVRDNEELFFSHSLWKMSEQHWGTSAVLSHGRWRQTAVAFTIFSQNEAGILRS